MFAVFTRDLIEAPEELSPPVPESPGLKRKTGSELVQTFCHAYPQSVSVQLDSSCSMVYSHERQDFLRPRMFGAVDNIFCIFEGMLENLPGLRQQYGLCKAANEVTVVMEAYKALRDRAPFPAHQVVRDLRGHFAFVLYDRAAGGLFTALDAHGKVPFYWGTAADGSLCFSDDASFLKSGCGKSFAPFPQGCYFASVVGLNSYEHPANEMKAMPRVDSSGQVCAAVFKVDNIKQKSLRTDSFGKGTNWVAAAMQ